MDIVSVGERPGKFVKGQSGNPKGRPPSKRDRLNDHKTKFDLAVRESLPAARLKRILAMIADDAEKGDKKSQFWLMEQFMTNAKTPEEVVRDTDQGITIRIENATFKAQPPELPQVPVEATVVEVKEIKDNG